jgi:hypothetical protein
MKLKPIFTAILVLVSALLFSQSPYQIVDSTKSWNTIHIGAGAWGVWHCGGTTTTIFEGDSVINGESYLKVFESQDSLQTNWEQVGLIREDTNTHQVFFNDYYRGEGLIYDFDLEIGDSVYVENFYNSESVLLITDSIDSIMINGISRNRYFLYSEEYYRTDIWIEGIGSLRGILYSGEFPPPGGDVELLCSHQDGTLIYMNPTFTNCFYNEFYPQILQETYDTAYLNTFYEFQLQIQVYEVDSFALIGNVIPEGFNFDITTGLLTGNPTQTGNFTCIITAENFDLGGGVLTDMIYEEIHVVLPTSIKQHSEQGEFNIFPNPTNGTFQIHSKQQENLSFQKLTIYNLEGKAVFESENPELLQSEIALPSLPNGMYFAKLSFSENTYSVKFLIQP